MSEEKEEKSGGGSIKNIIIGLVSTVALGVGGFVTKKLTGEKEEEKPAAAPAPVINITNSNQQQQAAGGKTVIIKEKAAEPAKQTPAPKKKDGDEFKEKPAQW
jgi:hypothetical protein